MFLEKILPSGGMYCVALLLPKGGFRHFFFEDLAAAQKQLTTLDTAGNTVYIAQATFDAEKITEAKAHNKALPYGHPRTDRMGERTQANAAQIKNFFLDIDCGEKWPLKSQQEAVAALNAFVKDTKLPFPAVVNSGTGLYAHWILEDAIPAAQWRTVAFMLKQVVAAYSPAIGGDSSRTSDSASVLRPEGATNRKPGRPEKRVTVLKDMEPVQFLDFAKVLGKAAKRKKINNTAVLAPKPNKDINAEFFGGLDQQSTPSDANKVADKCAQLGLMRTNKGDIVEPLWYACIGVLAHCQDGEKIIHEWSSGYDGYSPAETDAKLSQWRSAELGPTTCATIGGASAEGCVGCPHIGKVKSPILLGRPEPVVKALPDEQCGAPDGFRRAQDGLFASNEDRWIKFYDRDLYPDRLAYDESLGYEVMTIKHSLPHEGELECTLRSSMVNDPKMLLTTLSDNHIKVVGVREKKYMTAYLESYQAKLQRNRRMSLLLCQMGWKETRGGDPMFVLGKKIFHKDGRTEDASLAKNVPRAAEAFRTSGSLARWSEATRVLDNPGMEPFAFALLAGGFGAPLMKFTGFDGAMVSMVGPSSAGKTLMLRWIQSVWGYHNDLMMLRDDTKNALVSRLGVYGNLPMTIDEITNISGMDLSDLVYRITQGRDKARLTKNSEERKVLNAWNTLAVTSSNSSLVDKLSGAKHDASAEINRLFEYSVPKLADFEKHVTTGVYWAIHENYGHAGEVYAQWLVQHFDEVKLALDTMREKVETVAGITGEERFWAAVASVAIYGGLVAQSLGLIKFDVARVFTWVSRTLREMRHNKNDLTGNSVDILAQFIDAHAGNTLIVKGNARLKAGCIIIQAPRGSLDLRHEIDYNRLFISRAVLKDWITKRFGSYTQIKNDLFGIKALLDANKRRTLGAGTFYGGAPQACWEINLKCPDLGTKAIEMTRTAEMLAKSPKHAELDLGVGE